MNSKEIASDLAQVREFIIELESAVKDEIKPSREVSLVTRKLEESRGFIGFILGGIRGVDVYPSSVDYTSDVIDKVHREPGFEEFKLSFPPEADTNVKKIKFIRGVIGDLITQLIDANPILSDDVDQFDPHVSDHFGTNWLSALQNLKTALLWTGFALGAIRDNNERAGIHVN